MDTIQEVYGEQLVVKYSYVVDLKNCGLQNYQLAEQSCLPLKILGILWVTERIEVYEFILRFVVLHAGVPGNKISKQVLVLNFC